MKIYGRVISHGNTTGYLLISKNPISFFGMVNPKTGMIIDPNHDLYKQYIKDKILLFPNGCGSTVGSYTLYQLKKNNVAPRGIINIVCETIIAVGAIIADIPLIDKLSLNPYKVLKNGDKITINTNKKRIEF